MEKKVKDRITQLQKEIQIHQQRFSQAQQILNSESRQITAKQGAILEFNKLLGKGENLKKENKEEKKKEKKEEKKKVKKDLNKSF